MELICDRFAYNAKVHPHSRPLQEERLVDMFEPNILLTGIIVFAAG